MLAHQRKRGRSPAPQIFIMYYAAILAYRSLPMTSIMNT